MNCYSALRINSFSGSVNIDSMAESWYTVGEKRYVTKSNVSGSCQIFTPVTNFTNRELRCRKLLEYRIANDPEIATNGWLIRKGIGCENCEIEGNLIYENDGEVWGTVTDPFGNVEDRLFPAGKWGWLPWFNDFQYCKRQTAKRGGYWSTTAGCPIIPPGIILRFYLSEPFNGSNTQSESFGDEKEGSSGSGTFSFNVELT